MRFRADNREDIVYVVSNDDNAGVALQMVTEVKNPRSLHNSLLRISRASLLEGGIDAQEENAVTEEKIEVHGKTLTVKVTPINGPAVREKYYMHDDVPISGVIRSQQFDKAAGDLIFELTVADYGWTPPDFPLPDPSTATQVMDL